MFLELVEKTRTIRRFDAAKSITDTDLIYILDCARKTASAGNLQRIRYVTVSGTEASKAFSSVSLGGLLPKEKKPTQNVAPKAYIILTSAEENPDPNLLIDTGIAAQTIALAASQIGISSCMIRNFDREYFASLTTEKYAYPILVLALGYAVENAEILEVNDEETLKYYKNENDVNVVPKLSLENLIIRKHN